MDGRSLEEIPLFAKLTPGERAELEELLTPAHFDAGERIFEEGGVEESFFILTIGEVEVYKQVLPGRAQRLARMSAPTVVGEVGLLTEPKAIASVVARTSVEAQGIKRDEFLGLLDGGSLAACKVVYEIGKTLAGRMAKTDSFVSEVITAIEDESRDIDPDVFQDRLMQEWFS